MKTESGGQSARNVARMRAQLRRGAYFLPSLFTIGNIFLGFFATILSLRGRFELAGGLIILAAVVDFLDGKIARLTGTESDFGREFDSIADALTFGMAPAISAWAWGLSVYPRAGWLVPLFYLVCGATRLARYNVQTVRSDNRWFVGLPSPAAAGTVASLFLIGIEPDWRPWFVKGMGALMILLGLLMVSTFRFWSLKALDFRQRRSYRSALPIAAFIILLAFWPEFFLPGFALAYVASGPAGWALGRIGSRR